MLEDWNVGSSAWKLECWNNGMMEYWVFRDLWLKNSIISEIKG
jgi:hypothetical protein